MTGELVMGDFLFLHKNILIIKALVSKWTLSLAPSIELFFLHGDQCRGGGRWNCSVTTQSYTNALSPKGLVFLPFTMETLGGLHSGAVTQVKLWQGARAPMKVK